MRLSKTFAKSTKNVPSDEKAKNAQLLIKAGYVHKEMAGVYSYLPLGLRVLNNIANIVREEMNSIDGQEILMPALQIKERYTTTGRWDDRIVDDWFKTKLVNGTELGLGFSHEENLVPLMRKYISSYRDLPILAYQIQTKFRNELRSKSGLMRGREFLMKDMYSFAISQEEHEVIYTRVKEAYLKVFSRLGLASETYITTASGGSFSKYSHEFQTLSQAGEDTIYIDRDKKVAINKEVFTDDVIAGLGLKRERLEQVRAIEVGNIFSLGTKFTEPFGLKVNNRAGETQTLIMGCYGIGISRVLGTIVEFYSDDKGIVWPKSIAPARIILVRVGDNSKVIKVADKLYESIMSKGIEIIYDDRDVRPGEKFSDADLLGIPSRVIVSDKTVESGLFEFKDRTSTESQQISESALMAKLFDK